MTVISGLIIADPWIGHILDGRKDWEMRSLSTSHRGWFGLIRKGSGHVVGLARLVDCGRALSQAEMLENIAHHRIPEDMIRRREVEKWVVPWKLADIVRLAKPVPYEHKSGAVTWVKFSPDVTQQLVRCLESNDGSTAQPISPHSRTIEQGMHLSGMRLSTSETIPPRKTETLQMLDLPEGERRILGRSHLSGGNVRNNHINLSKILNAFPHDVIGGTNKAEAAARQLQIDWGGPQSVMTDIDGSKSIFRGRGWVRRFFEASDAQEGDVVVITETAPYHISVQLERNETA
jgi:hypothetical protein